MLVEPYFKNDWNSARANGESRGLNVPRCRNTWHGQGHSCCCGKAEEERTEEGEALCPHTPPPGNTSVPGSASFIPPPPSLSFVWCLTLPVFLTVTFPPGMVMVWALYIIEGTSLPSLLLPTPQIAPSLPLGQNLWFSSLPLKKKKTKHQLTRKNYRQQGRDWGRKHRAGRERFTRPGEGSPG